MRWFLILGLFAPYTPYPPGPAPAVVQTAAASNQVNIVDNAFSPGTQVVSVGDTVTWANTGKRTHTTTSDTGLWGSSPLSSGGTFAFTFSAPGTYAYHCVFHEEMHGTITVQVPATPTATATPPVTGAPPTATPTAIAAAPAPIVATATSTPAVTPTPVGPPPLAATRVDPISGGAINTAAQNITLAFSPGAVSSVTNVLLQADVPVAVAAPDGYTVGTTRFRLAALDASGLPTAMFQAPVTLTIRPGEAELADVGGDPTSLTLSRFDEDTATWSPIETTIGDDGSLSAAIDRPASFAVLEVVAQ